MITVYYGMNPRLVWAHTRAKEPYNVYEDFLSTNADGSEKNLETLGYHRCPAFAAEMTNVYGLKSIYDFRYRLTGNPDNPGELHSDYDDTFFERNGVRARCFEQKLFTMGVYYYFFTEEDTLEMSYIHPYLEDNRFTERCILIPGKLDIGVYLRGLDMSYHLREKNTDFQIKQEDTYAYVKFHTKEKIQFKKFLFSPTLMNLDDWMMREKQYKMSHKRLGLKYFYNIFKHNGFKKKVLKEIKENGL